MMSFRSYTLTGLLLAACASGWIVARTALARSYEATSGSSISGNASAGDADQDLVPAPMPDWFKFQSNDTVNGWINTLDNKSITGHAWDLWGAITTLTDQQHNGQKVPVYETWWSAEEALAPPAALAAAARQGRRVLQLHAPKQFDRLKPDLFAARPPVSLFSIAKYNDSIKKRIDEHKYNDGKELARINAAWGNTKPIAERKLVDFDNDAVMLKPVYRFIPGENTWTKRMLVVPPDLNLDAKSLSLQDAGQPIPAFPLSDFYSIKLSKDDAAFLGPRAKEGDYVILVAMHVSSREIDNWTWQTFWWSFDKPEVPDASKVHVKAPFDHYQVAVGYSFMTAPDNPQSLTVTCFNPYLEAGFDPSAFVYTTGQTGIQSNCMSCHRTAAWPGPDQLYAANGVIDPSNPTIFAGKTKTDFLWGIADRVAAPPGPPSP